MRRRFLTLADQVIFSLSNIVVALLGFATGLAVAASINAVMWWQALSASLKDAAQAEPVAHLDVVVATAS